MATTTNAIIISGTAISNGTTGTATLYTAPANSYAKVQISISGGSGAVTATIGGRVVLTGTIGATVAFNQAFIIGPGQSFIVTSNASSLTVNITGATFTNFQ